MLTEDRIKRTLASLRYRWYEDRPNIIGVRTSLDVPDVFNDFLCLQWKEAGVSKFKIYPFTTDPGVAYQKKLLNPKGCAVMQPGQYVDCYQIGYHKGREDHRALIQIGVIKVLRDKDLDGIAGNSGIIEVAGGQGCNIHGSQKAGTTKAIGPWSAGCQVHPIWKNKEEMMDIAEKFEVYTANKFTYTLITEKQLIS